MATQKTSSIITSILTFAESVIDAINGWADSVLREGHEVLVLIFGEDDHQWSRTAHGPALVAFDLDSGDKGWISPRTLAGGIIYVQNPKSFEWSESSKAGASWWICKDTAKTEYVQFGLAASGVHNACGTEDHLMYPVVIKVTKKDKGYVSSPVPANQVALDKIQTFNPSAVVVAAKPSKSKSGFTLSGSYWLGEARPATSEDLEKVLEGAALEAAKKTLRK